MTRRRLLMCNVRQILHYRLEKQISAEKKGRGPKQYAFNVQGAV
jgi:hypothetical protein